VLKLEEDTADGSVVALTGIPVEAVLAGELGAQPTSTTVTRRTGPMKRRTRRRLRTTGTAPPSDYDTDPPV